MSEILYHNTNSFFLLDYNPSHSELIFRSMIKGKEIYNIDIFFKGVCYIAIPTRLSDFSIIENKKEQYFKENDIRIDTDKDIRLFCFNTSYQKKFFIACYYFCVFENNLNTLETPLGDFLWSEQNRQIYISS
jgi:hypothetical protein